MSALGNKKTMSRNITRLMNQHGKTRGEMCAALDVPYTTFTDWVSAKTYPRIDKIELMARYFGVTKAELVEEPDTLTGLESLRSLADDVVLRQEAERRILMERELGTPYTPTQRIPIVGRISAGLPVLAEQNVEGYTYTDLNHGGEYVALRVSGDSMNSARICDGDIIIIRLQNSAENGEIVAVLVDGEDATVKRYYHSGHQVTLMPQSSNPAHQPQLYDTRKVPIRIVGKVVEIKISV